MGGDKHAPYFIAAYALSALVLGWMVVDTWLRARRWRRRVAELEKAKAARANVGADVGPRP